MFKFECRFQLPRQEELKTVVDKVKDFFGDAKESFGKLTSLDSTTEAEQKSNEESKWVRTELKQIGS